jgi:transposase
MTTKGKRYPAEVRERAVRLVLEHRGEYQTEWAAITSIAQKCGMTAETLRKWVRQVEVDGGRRPGVSSEEAQRTKELERENKELVLAPATRCPTRHPSNSPGTPCNLSASIDGFGLG